MRLSGPAAPAIAQAVFRSHEPLRDRVAIYGRFADERGTIDRGLALLFAAPRSYTGEDVVEFHVHGSPLVARDLLTAVFAAGARQAHPGEFTRRAFEHGKLDLCAAESVGELIAAEHRASARAAAANLSGGLARELERLRAALGSIVEELAAALDFPDEVPAPAPDGLLARIGAVRAALGELAASYERGLQVREGVSVAIVGPPNAGKSSLLNALLQADRALVSATPGTTRDTIEESLAVGELRLLVIDTAGLRATQDPLERAGIERTESALASARIALVVIDGSAELTPPARELLRTTRGRERLVFFNKRDAGRRGYDEREEPERDALFGSAYENATIAAVTARLEALIRVSEQPDTERASLATARQAAAVRDALRSLDVVETTLASGAPVDLCNADLVAALAALGELSGRDASEAVLDAIFARFCIGK